MRWREDEIIFLPYQKGKAMTVEDDIQKEALAAGVISICAVLAAWCNQLDCSIVCITVVWSLHAVMVSQLNRDEATINANCNATKLTTIVTAPAIANTGHPSSHILPFVRRLIDPTLHDRL